MMYCDPPATITQVQPGNRNLGPGSIVVLSSGAWFEIKSPYVGDPNGLFVHKLRQSDRVQICFGPTIKWTDPDLSGFRPSIINDADSDSYIYAVACPQVVSTPKGFKCKNRYPFWPPRCSRGRTNGC
jgi:hypothetical protein